MAERSGLWALLVFVIMLAVGQWGIIGKCLLGPSSQRMQVDPCPTWFQPLSISCGAAEPWREAIDDADWPEH